MYHRNRQSQRYHAVTLLLMISDCYTKSKFFCIRIPINALANEKSLAIETAIPKDPEKLKSKCPNVQMNSFGSCYS